MLIVPHQRCRPQRHWGNHLWGFIHTVCIIDYNDNYETNLTVLTCLQNLLPVIPCPKCKREYAEYLKKLPLLDLREPMILFYWSVDLHNAVNAKLGKPLWSYERAKAEWCHTIDGLKQ